MIIPKAELLLPLPVPVCTMISPLVTVFSAIILARAVWTFAIFSAWRLFSSGVLSVICYFSSWRMLLPALRTSCTALSASGVPQTQSGELYTILSVWAYCARAGCSMISSDREPPR